MDSTINTAVKSWVGREKIKIIKIVKNILHITFQKSSFEILEPGMEFTAGNQGEKARSLSAGLRVGGQPGFHEMLAKQRQDLNAYFTQPSWELNWKAMVRCARSLPSGDISEGYRPVVFLISAKTDFYHKLFKLLNFSVSHIWSLL